MRFSPKETRIMTLIIEGSGEGSAVSYSVLADGKSRQTLHLHLFNIRKKLVARYGEKGSGALITHPRVGISLHLDVLH